MKSQNTFLKPITTLLLGLSAAVLLAPAALGAKKKKGEAPPPPPPLEINLGAPFRDGAVLQRESKAPVWGWSKPGMEVTVEFAGQKKSATAGQDGKWMLHLDPLKTSAEGSEMTIREKDGKSVILKDLLVGEVWMASGQSNMQWVVGSSSGRLLVEKIKQQAGENGTLSAVKKTRTSSIPSLPSPSCPASPSHRPSWVPAPPSRSARGTCRRKRRTPAPTPTRPD